MTTQLIALLADRPALLAEIRRRVAKYSEDQPRDDHGRWTDGGGGGPSMSRSEADAWATDSVVKQDYFHFTSSAGAEAIKRDGFNTHDGVFGEGVYFTSSNESAKLGARSADERLDVRINVDNVLEVEDGKKLAAWYKKALKNSPDGGTITELAEKQGFQAIKVNNPNNTGANYLIVFNRKNVTVIQ